MYPTTHHFGIPAIVGDDAITFELSNSGNTGSKVHCGTDVDICLYYHSIVVRRDVWLLRPSRRKYWISLSNGADAGVTQCHKCLSGVAQVSQVLVSCWHHPVMYKYSPIDYDSGESVGRFRPVYNSHVCEGFVSSYNLLEFYGSLLSAM